MRIPDSIFNALKAFDTCTIANAIECYDLQLRNEGYTTNTALHCHFPEYGPMLGYALTLRVRSANPPMEGGVYLNRTDWWEKINFSKGPHILVIEDADRHPGVGSFMGEVHAAMMQALGCVGVITNGAVRDLPAVRKLGFHFFSASVSPSHAYAHVVEMNSPVEIAGLRVKPGELLIGDCHGIVRIPASVAESLPEAATRLRNHEREIVAYCQSKDFTHQGLKDLIKRPRS
jgi:regulator of RNase E activity RraA